MADSKFIAEATAVLHKSCLAGTAKHPTYTYKKIWRKPLQQSFPLMFNINSSRFDKAIPTIIYAAGKESKNAKMEGSLSW